MKRKPFVFVVCLIACLLAGSTWAGRPDKDWKSWFGHFAGGYTAPTGGAGEILNGGFNLNGGATYWPETWPIGIDLELGYNDWSVKNELMQSLADQTMFPGTLNGDVDVWSLTVDGMWGPPPGGGINIYFAGGVGAYYERGTLSTPVTGVGIVCPPLAWYCFPGVISGSGIIDEESSTNFGYNAGVGLTFEVGLGSQIYIEAKYHRYRADRGDIDYIPVVLGYRW